MVSAAAEVKEEERNREYRMSKGLRVAFVDDWAGLEMGLVKLKIGDGAIELLIDGVGW